MQELENRMAVDSEWRWNGPPEARESLSGPGYYNPLTSVFVPEEDAFDYAVERISLDEDLKRELVERFYIDWIEEDQEK